MNFIEFIQLLLRNKKWIIAFPIITGVAVFFLTRNMPHTYSSEMVIYTGIASGYNFNSDAEGKIDYHEANSKFDNLINTITSKETRKVVALRLLADLINHPQELNRVVTKLKLERFDWLNDSSTLKKVRGASEAATMQNLSAQILQGSQNPYYQLLYGQYANPFNLSTLNTIKATRIGFSDMVKVEYTSEDAFITKKTLDLLAEVFLQKYKGMRIGEVSSVVKYFEEQTALALARLQKAEMILKNFRTTNRLINYYEQTKYIADQKEDYDQRESQLQMDLEGYKSALAKVEKKLSSRAVIQLKSDEVVKSKDELSAQYNSLGLSLVKGNQNDAAKNTKIDALKKDLKENIQGLYEVNNSIEGIPGKDLLDEWLSLTVSTEEGTAKLKVLEKSKAEFEKIYDLFAPMGSDLNKLERDVDVSEKEYLNLLHNLNQAKLRERNLVVTENISITDPPDMPAVPNSSKRLILVIAAAFSCFIIVMVVLMMKEYLDDSISNPLNFLKTTGVKTATAFVKSTAENNATIENINAISNERWMLSLVDLQQQNKIIKVLVVPFHKSNSDYKQMLADVTSNLQSLGNNWQAVEFGNMFTSDSNQLIFTNTSKRELINKEVISNSDVIYLFINAAQKMDEYQLQLLDSWKQLNIPMQAVMVDTKINHLEKFLGEVPKQRSYIRKRIKDIVRRYSK
ncbi:MAG: hypothetical protein IPO27_04755 [Bacteroidetes bacterium]|nr:hypothetical protein [Bacteroidota bacterium]